MTLRPLSLAVPFLASLALVSGGLTAFAQTPIGIDTLPAEDQEIVRGLAFKKLEPAPLASRRFSYIKGEVEVENTGPKNSIAGKLHADMSLLFLNKDQDWVVVSCGKDFAITTKGHEAIQLSFHEENDLFETLFGDRNAKPVTTHTVVRYGGVVIFEDPLDPIGASAPKEWWTQKTGVIGHASDDVVAALSKPAAPPPIAMADIGSPSKAPSTVPPPAPPSTPKPSMSSTAAPPAPPPAVPAPAPAPAPTPPATVPVQPITQPQGVVLDRLWLTPIQGGSATIKDLGALLSPFASPSANTAAAPNLKIYRGVTYLMPYLEAKKVLSLEQKVVPKNKVICPGFPRDSFFHYSFSGSFEGHFNQMYIVTDKADQVVAIQLVSESPKVDQVDAPSKPTDWHAYNFVNSRTKGTKRLWIDHKPWYEDKTGWHEYSATNAYRQPKGELEVLRIDTVLLDPATGNSSVYRGNGWKPLEAVRLYLPKPMMELILQCVRSTNR